MRRTRMTRAQRVVAGLLALMASVWAPRAFADEEPVAEPDIVEELTASLTLVDGQIAQQEALLHSATSERERALISDHIRRLRKESRSLESLRHQLIQTDPLAMESEFEKAGDPARQVERQREQWQQREELIRDREP